MNKLEKMGYRFLGKHKHAAIKICEWTRESLRGKNVCYKQQFYGIQTHRCIQLGLSVKFCTHRCDFCWRDTEITSPVWNSEYDEPEDILNDAIFEQRKILQGFKGFEKTDMKKFKESMFPNQVAVSLSGEACLYPKLPELLDAIKKREMTSFLVTNGTCPDVIENLIKHPPYQLYITLPAPNEEIYNKICKPVTKDGWKKILKSLSLLKNFERSVIRLTSVKGINMNEPEEYAKIISNSKARWVEVKGYMAIGFARSRLGPEHMPTHAEVKEFAEKIAMLSGYKIKGEKADSRVVLLER